MCVDAISTPKLGLLLTAAAELGLLVYSQETWVEASSRSVRLREFIDLLIEVAGEAGDRVSKALPTEQPGQPVRDAAALDLPQPSRGERSRGVQQSRSVSNHARKRT